MKIKNYMSKANIADLMNPWAEHTDALILYGADMYRKGINDCIYCACAGFIVGFVGSVVISEIIYHKKQVKKHEEES